MWNQVAQTRGRLINQMDMDKTVSILVFDTVFYYNLKYLESDPLASGGVLGFPLKDGSEPAKGAIKNRQKGDSLIY